MKAEAIDIGARLRSKRTGKGRGDMQGLTASHPYPGKLIIVEGIDGSGKIDAARAARTAGCWRRAASVFFTEWNSSALVRRSMKRGKKKDLLTPTTFSMLHAVDFADRLTYKIIPPLKAGMIVLADRYVYTAFGRDVARGVDNEWVRGALQLRAQAGPGALFPRADRSLAERLLTGRTKLKYHEAGMDVGLSRGPGRELPAVPEPRAGHLRRAGRASSVCA